MIADVNVDQHRHFNPIPRRELRQYFRFAHRSDRQHHMLSVRSNQSRNASDLPPFDNRRRQQQVVDAGPCDRFGLVHRGDTNSDRPGPDLPLRDLRALVRFGMRPEVHLCTAAMFGHRSDVGVEPIEIDQQSGRRNFCLGERDSHSRQRRVSGLRRDGGHNTGGETGRQESTTIDGHGVPLFDKPPRSRDRPR